MNKKIYLDNAATTRVRPEVVEAMLPYFTEKFGNPSSVYEFASQNKSAVDEAREVVDLAPIGGEQGSKILQSLNNISSDIADDYQMGGNNGKES